MQICESLFRSVSINTLPWPIFTNSLPRDWIIVPVECTLKIISFDIIPVASEYQNVARIENAVLTNINHSIQEICVHPYVFHKDSYLSICKNGAVTVGRRPSAAEEGVGGCYVSFATVLGVEQKYSYWRLVCLLYTSDAADE